MPRCPRLRPHSTAGGLYSARGRRGQGAWEPLECRPLVVAESAVSPPLLSRCPLRVSAWCLPTLPGPTSWRNYFCHRCFKV